MPKILIKNKEHTVSSIIRKDKRILFDFTVSHKWLKNGHMIGIARECQELFNEFENVNVTEMVYIQADKDGTPIIKKINKKTLSITDEIIQPNSNDIIFTADIQIRGVHVPCNHPAIGYFEKFGVERYAVINDILPIIYPEYFESKTSSLMPSYIINIFKNYNKILCISKATYDSLMIFCKYYKIDPLNITLNNSLSATLEYPFFRGDYNYEDDGITCRGDLYFSLFTPNTKDDINISFNAKCMNSSFAKVSLSINGNHLGVIDIEKNIANYRFNIAQDKLLKYGLQEIKFAIENKQSLFHKTNTVLFKNIHITSVNQKRILISEIINNDIQIGFLHLGASKLNNDCANSQINHRIETFFKHKKVFLMVGTIEPRKGHAIVLDAFEKLWATGSKLNLCVIGKIGWNVLGVVERIKKEQSKGRLLFLDGAPDYILQYAYKKSFCLIQASADEGFGLPLIEASQFNLPILCSDIPVFREVAGNNAIYFDRNDLDSLTNKIQSIVVSKNIPPSNRIHYNSWTQCANRFINYFYEKHNYPCTIKMPIEKKLKKRRKMLVAIMFGIYPPIGGGQVRVYGLYKELAKYFDVEILGFSPSYCHRKTTNIVPGLTETLIPKTSKQELGESSLSNKLGVSSTDLFIMMNSKINNEYINVLSEKAKTSDYIVASHAYMFPLIKNNVDVSNKCLIYEAHNVEYIAKTNMMVHTPYAKSISKTLFNVEKECCEKSDYILTCSSEDSSHLQQLYNLNRDKIIVAPNGVDTSIVKFTNVPKRIINKKNVCVQDATFGLFLGSSYPPNVEACNTIISIADKCPLVTFLLVGSVCDNFLDKKLPRNVGLTGRVSETEKMRLLSIADFAINTVVSGSGTNIKMFDYLAAGIPIITTKFGSRGIDNKKILSIVDSKDDLIKKINCFDLGRCSKTVCEARNYVEKCFDWKVIAKNVYDKIKVAI